MVSGSSILYLCHGRTARWRDGVPGRRSELPLLWWTTPIGVGVDSLRIRSGLQRVSDCYDSTRDAVISARIPRSARLRCYDSNFTYVKSFSRSLTFPALNAPSEFRHWQKIYVNSHSKTQEADDVKCDGPLHVDVFGPHCGFIPRLVTQGPLNALGGLLFPPANFGTFINALLMATSAGMDHAFDPTDRRWRWVSSKMRTSQLRVDGLWGVLAFATDTSAGMTNELFFHAEFQEKPHGLFGKFHPSITPLSLWGTRGPGKN